MSPVRGQDSRSSFWREGYSFFWLNGGSRGAPFLTEGPVTASLTVFFLGENFQLCLSVLFSLIIGVELKRMGFEQEWRLRPADLF